MNRLSAITLILVLASPLVTLANGPIHDSVEKKTAQWKKADDQITGKIAKLQLANMKKNAEALHSILQDSCLANSGLQPIWHGEYLAEKAGDATQLKYSIECDFAGKANLSILVNDLSPLTGHITINRQDVMTLPISAGVHNECPYFESASTATTKNETAGKDKQSFWLVTARPDMLPYIAVTRKEYLNMVIGDLNNTKQHIIADVKSKTPVRTAEQQAAEKKRDLDDLNNRYSGNELQMRTRSYLDRYKTDEDYLKENEDNATADVDTTIHMIQGMLEGLAPATLAAPAIVSPASTEFLGFRDEEPGMVMLIRNNPSFFEPGAAQEKPQFFLITWNSGSDDGGATDAITKNLDTRVLKEMLKK